MTYKDLSNFTYKELRFFTYADISLDKYELIAKAENQSIDLPEDIQKKLRSLCTELANHHPNQEPLFKNFSFRKINDAMTLIINLTKVHEILLKSGSYDRVHDVILQICAFLSKH